MRSLGIVSMVLATGALVAGCAEPAPQAAAQPRTIELRNAGFEDPTNPADNCVIHWSCSAHADPGSYRYRIDESAPGGGKRSLLMERVRNEPWGLITQGIWDRSLIGAKLRYSIAVRTEGVSGQGAGVYFFAVASGGGRVGHTEKLVQGTTGWQRLTIEFVVPSSSSVFEVGAAMYGPGKLWLDDAKLEVLEPAPPKKPV
jgi:hypothetical protein